MKFINESRAWILFTLALYILQSSLLPFISYRGVSANLLLLFVVSFSFLKGFHLGVFAGFCAGLLQALATGTFFGIDILSFMLIAIICGRMSDNVFKDQFLLPIATSVIAATIHYLVWAFFIKILGYNFPIEENLRYTLPAICAFQFIFSYPVHKATYLIDQKFAEQKYSGWRRKSKPDPAS